MLLCAYYRRVDTSQYSSLIILLLRMALDTSDHHMRDATARTLHNVLGRLNDEVILLSIAQDILALVEPLSFRDRYVVLSFLPLETENERSLVRGLCYQLLFPVEVRHLQHITCAVSGKLTLLTPIEPIYRAYRWAIHNFLTLVNSDESPTTFDLLYHQRYR